MLYKSVSIILMAFVLSATSMPLAAQAGKSPAPPTANTKPESVPDLLKQANKAYAKKDYLTFRKSLQRLHQLRPYNSGYMSQLVIAHALLNEQQAAYSMMLTMQQQGLADDFSETDSTLSIRGTEVFDYVNDLLKIAGNPSGQAEPVFVLPEDVDMPETIAWDESRQKFLVGTIAQGQILAVGMDGEVKELLKASDENGMWAVFDILVDVPRNRLWVTSASMPGFSGYTPADKGRSALIELNLETLEFIRRHPVPVDGKPHLLGNMVLGPNGDIFIADRALPLVYVKPAAEEKLKPILFLKEMVSQRGIAMQPDGRIMYVADRERGIMVVDLEGRQARLLEVPETLNVGGIDGMYLKDNRLFIIQNGISPQRLMRLQLDSSGTRVAAVGPLAVALPEFELPSFGTIKGDELYYFANSQWLDNKGSQKPVTVVRSALNVDVDLMKPELEQFLKMQAEDNKQNPPVKKEN